MGECGMKNKLKVFFLNHKITKNIYCDLFRLKLLKRNLAAKTQREEETKQATQIINNMSETKRHIFFCGVPVHKNMGDQAQRYCIRQWCQQN